MKFETKALLADISAQIGELIAAAEKLKQLPLVRLNQKASPESWSALECLAHLNLYGDFYLPEIEQKLLETSTKATATFKSGWLGNYFANSMLPKSGKVNKMKTFASKNPNNSELSSTTIDKFIKQQQQMLQLIKLSEQANLAKVKVGSSIGKWLKLRLGDTFRFLTNHCIRHMQQANRAAGLAN